MFTYYKTPVNVAMGMLDFFCKHDGFNGWILEDSSRVNFVDGKFVEVFH
jgi:hypothetical protein